MRDRVEEPESLEIQHPSGSTAVDPEQSWTIFAKNKKVLDGWNELVHSIYSNASRCYEWLRKHPKQRIPGRCYELKHKHYAGAWCFEIGSGQRIYYKLREEKKEVVIYYAGQHPRTVPYPPTDE